RLDSYHLRLLGDLSILLDGVERIADGRLGGLVGDQDDRRRCAKRWPRVDAGPRAAWTPLHDALKRHPAIAHVAGTFCHRAGAVEQGKAYVVGALVTAKPRAVVSLEAGSRHAEGVRRAAPGDIENVAHHRRGGGPGARARASQQQVADRIAVDGHT